MNLASERLNQGLSRRQAAAAVGVTAKVLARAERGEGVHPNHAKLIADFYGVKVTDLWPLEHSGDKAAA